ncbi:hypothetical protein MMC08_009093 [Hypocenomyce scalaris]|nr:hypothetical protein [Hypocenomyce scalaris]
MTPSPVEASCYCGTNTHIVTLATTSPTIHKITCHCDSCRHWSGALSVYYLPITSSPSDLQHLKAYSFTEHSFKYFCPKCGSHMFHLDKEGWAVAPGVLEQLPVDVELEGHEFVGDTGDGGMSVWLSTWNATELPRWKELARESEQLASEWPDTTTEASIESESPKLWAGCHCGGVKFYITRPTEESRLGLPLAKARWLAANGTKYAAGFCSCTSCRKATGFDVQPWALVPQCNIFQANGEAMAPGVGTLARAEKEGGPRREYCSKCGATVFLFPKSWPTLPDVAVGLFKGAGARAEEWLQWVKVVHTEEAVNKRLIRELSEGLEVWARK